MAYKAVHRHARISARKVRPIADLIRGKQVDEALAILRYQPHRGARMIEKVLKSALGNAEDQRAPNIGGLRVIDVSDPTAPFDAGFFDTGDFAVRVHVECRHAVFGGAARDPRG